jgi:hypothetical protein
VSGVHAIPCCERADDCAPPNAAPPGYNVEVTSLATDGRTSLDYSRATGKPEAKSRPNSQLRGREVGFEEIAIDLSEARFWIVSGLPTTRELSLLVYAAGIELLRVSARANMCHALF